MVCVLSVNVNAIAYLRNRRGLPWPDVCAVARLALEAGAHGITVHPRPDGRHITGEDVRALRAMMGDFPGRELNVEGNPTQDFVDLVTEVRPHQVTLVPDEVSQATSDHGCDLFGAFQHWKAVTSDLSACDMRVSLFIDADFRIPPLAQEAGAQCVEIYTGPYALAGTDGERGRLLDGIFEAAQVAHRIGMRVHAGHDLTLENLGPLLGRVPWMREVSIGHALTGDALVHGMAETVRRYLAICQGETDLGSS